MSAVLILLIAVLFTCGTYLVLHRSLTRIILGIATLGNGVNLVLLVAGGRAGAPPFVGEAEPQADPLPQALLLTAIVIGFSLQAFLLALTWRNWTLDGNDEVEDDLEDRRVARDDDDLLAVDEARGAPAGDPEEVGS